MTSYVTELRLVIFYILSCYLPFYTVPSLFSSVQLNFMIVIIIHTLTPFQLNFSSINIYFSPFNGLCCSSNSPYVPLKVSQTSSALSNISLNLGLFISKLFLYCFNIFEGVVPSAARIVNSDCQILLIDTCYECLRRY
jgi:hypothetical protein